MNQLWSHFSPLVLVGAMFAAPVLTLGFIFAWRRHGFAHDRAVILRATGDAFLALWGLALVLTTQATVAPGVTTRPLQLVPFEGLAPLITRSVAWEVPAAQIGGLVLLFLPLGVLRALRYGWGLGRGVLTGAAVAVSAAALQWILGAGRVAATDDVLVATLGVFLGAALVVVARGARVRVHSGARVAVG